MPARLEARVASAALAATASVAGTTLLPFYPLLLAALITVSATVAMWIRPRAGLALALAAPVLPLGNISKGAAFLYAIVATGWLLAWWRDARSGLAFMLGPILAPFGALALLPLLVQPCKGPARRALAAGTGVLAAAGVAGLQGNPMPLTGERVENLGLGGVDSAWQVASAITDTLTGIEGIVITAVGLAAAAYVLPIARRHGRWGIAVLGAGTIAFVLISAPTVAAAPIVIGTWALCAALAVKAGS
jgi:hypothetical protein